jgi:hypothetical protein
MVSNPSPLERHNSVSANHPSESACAIVGALAEKRQGNRVNSKDAPRHCHGRRPPRGYRETKTRVLLFSVQQDISGVESLLFPV